MDEAKKQLVDKLKTANNILVTVSRDPNVDQLASCLGLALFLNKQGKHTAAVFSGKVPSTLEFLKPEETLEKNTDSLRDFIIALDKSKADKLRYKVEDNVVRIFITPYKTSIGQEDLEFSQGDFNVDLVLALGVNAQEDLDEAIMAHGRILHDATVASITLESSGRLGSINLTNPQASSLSEIVTELARTIDADLIDAQIATALLTGIVSSTDRFKNDKTSSQALTASANLMAAGANQQLVTSQLEAPQPAEPEISQSDETQPNAEQQVKDEADKPAESENTDQPPANNDGTIEIEHPSGEVEAEQPSIDLPPANDNAPVEAFTEDATIVDPLAITPEVTEASPTPPPELNNNLSQGSKIMTEPPTLGGTLTANSVVEGLDPSTDPLSLSSGPPPQILDHQNEPADTASQLTPPPLNWQPPADPVFNDQPPAMPSASQTIIMPDTSAGPAAVSGMPPIVSPAANPTQTDLVPPAPAVEDQAEPQHQETLSELEADVKASEQQVNAEADSLDNARDEVSRALSTSEATMPPAPIEALNAQPMVDNLHPTLQEVLAETPKTPPQIVMPADVNSLPPANNNAQVIDPSAPPVVPPPIPFQFGNQNSQQQ